MVYNCEICNYSTNYNSNMLKHEKTKKHRNNLLKQQKEAEEIGLMNQNEPKMNQNEPKNFYCRYCNRGFSSKPSMRRHELHRCKNEQNMVYENKIEQMRKQFDREKNKLYKQIDKLIDKAGDTTINNTNNIQLNNFGEEDTSYITDKVLQKLINYPATMIPNLLKLTHFHEDHPENNNLKITNKKDKYIKVYKNDEWKIDKRDIVIDNIMNNKFDTLETYYEERGKNNIKRHIKKRFERFQDDIDSDNKNTISKVKEDITLKIVNNS